MLLFLGCLFLVVGKANCDLKVSTNVIAMEVQRVTSFQIEISNPPGDNSNKTLVLITQYDDLMQVIPNSLEIGFDNKTCNNSRKYEIKLYSLKAGKSGMSLIITSPLPEIIWKENIFLVVQIYNSNIIGRLSKTLGWLYFLAWSLSFYPQIYCNFKNKSVVGLSFDFIFFNLFGYVMYNSFNLGMYFIPIIKEQYALRHPRSVNPVYANDIFFSMHSLIATILTVFQCIKYESGSQTVSTFAKIIVGIDNIANIGFVILAGLDVILWLDLLYVCSYIKLIVTVTKYMPQVYLNYKRKTTQGWSIGSVALDFTGGLLSTLQMILDGYNYGDWAIILENPTKFGLGLISTMFDVVFLIQHFVLYGVAPNTHEIDMQQIAEQNESKNGMEEKHC